MWLLNSDWKPASLNAQFFCGWLAASAAYPLRGVIWELVLENSRRFQLRNLPPSHQPADSARAAHVSHRHRRALSLSACGSYLLVSIYSFLNKQNDFHGPLR